jgi:hypothetical protein
MDMIKYMYLKHFIKKKKKKEKKINATLYYLSKML